MRWSGYYPDSLIQAMQAGAAVEEPKANEDCYVSWVLLNLDRCAQQVAEGRWQGPDRPAWARYYERFWDVRLSHHQKFVVRRVCEQVRSGHSLAEAFKRVAFELDLNNTDVLYVFLEVHEKVLCAPDVRLPHLFKRPRPAPARARRQTELTPIDEVRKPAPQAPVMGARQSVLFSTATAP
jgi:hypothetical protein